MKKIEYRGKKKLTKEEMDELLLKLKTIRGDVEKRSKIFTLRIIIILIIIGTLLALLPIICINIFSSKNVIRNYNLEEILHEK